MSEIELPRPAVTVASIVERDGRFLMVEETTRHGLRLNQPAGHLEAGETLDAGAARETLEETAWVVEPVSLVGIYRWEAPEDRTTYVRFAFAGRAIRHEHGRELDRGIERAVWLSYDELVARNAEHRSPLVLMCIDDYLGGRRWPIDAIREVIR